MKAQGEGHACKADYAASVKWIVPQAAGARNGHAGEFIEYIANIH